MYKSKLTLWVLVPHLPLSFPFSPLNALWSGLPAIPSFGIYAGVQHMLWKNAGLHKHLCAQRLYGRNLWKTTRVLQLQLQSGVCPHQDLTWVTSKVFVINLLLIPITDGAEHVAAPPVLHNTWKNNPPAPSCQNLHQVENAGPTAGRSCTSTPKSVQKTTAFSVSLMLRENQCCLTMPERCHSLSYRMWLCPATQHN